jgi:hypothetical protein
MTWPSARRSRRVNAPMQLAVAAGARLCRRDASGDCSCVVAVVPPAGTKGGSSSNACLDQLEVVVERVFQHA